ncbi:hypothetical protein Ahy_B02g061002 [Arachis hypogaea]|uniref:DUF3700 domain-containing protein n=1 Tax=Arachis hypogaea TaxID=3818 RepID=A0A445AJU4_ARAHY|nr:hypothetical protein Ahy_B02g061002 [Arachis hypogaea]
MSSSHYTKNGRNVMLKITSSQTASSPDSNASEAYKTLRDHDPYPAAHVVRDFQGKFALKGILDSDLVPLKLRQRVSCAFVRMKISLLIAKIIMLHSIIRGHIKLFQVENEGTITGISIAGAFGIGVGIWYLKKVRAKASEHVESKAMRTYSSV